MSLPQKTAQAVVIGGGLSGICAALSLGRMGIDTILIHNRTVLGGNSSSEIGVPIGSADRIGNRRHARETGLIDELLLDNAWFPNWSDPTTSQGFSGAIWDVVLRNALQNEKNITLLLGTTARNPVVQDGYIRSVLAEQTEAENSWEIFADLFIDCSGDGRIAFESGADSIQGAESCSTYGETMAPAEPAAQTMGSSVYMRARDIGQYSPFEPPDWIHTFESDEDFPGGWLDCPHELLQLQGYPGGYWWFEFGGEMDTIKDQQNIHFELIRYALGVWDHIKNKGEHGADNFILDWIGPIPGKRESRRFLGDYVLCQQDLENLHAFEDAVAYGGWNIDIHYPHGISGKGKRYWYGKELAGKYSIPLRSLYSRNIHNLMFAGRNASVSHVALGSTRIMATCAMMGQAAGNAAALCIKYRKTPREIYADHLSELQKNLIWQDVYIPGISGLLQDNLARNAHACASSEAPLVFPKPEKYQAVSGICCQAFIAKQVKKIALPLENTSDHEICVRLELRQAHQIDLFMDAEVIATQTALLAPGQHTLSFPFDILRDTDTCWQVWLFPAPSLRWGFSVEEPPATCMGSQTENGEILGSRGTFCMELFPESFCYGPQQVTTGVNRPEKTSNVWISQEGFEQWLQLQWESPVEFNVISIVLDDNLDRPLRRINTYRAAPELIKDYEIEVFLQGTWVSIVSVRKNHHRLRVHHTNKITTCALRFRALSSNGASSARIVEIRVGLDDQKQEEIL